MAIPEVCLGRLMTVVILVHVSLVLCSDLPKWQFVAVCPVLWSFLTLWLGILPRLDGGIDRLQP